MNGIAEWSNWCCAYIMWMWIQIYLGPMFTMVLCLRISFPKAKKLSVESWNNLTLKTVTQWKKTTKKLSFKAVTTALGTWVKQLSAMKEMHSFNLLI